jgi:3',5'-cyclic AMP phosphodiesterase CpdA
MKVANLDAAEASIPHRNESGHPRSFRVGIVADTHIVDSYYKGPENNQEDTESMAHTHERLLAARDVINALHVPVEQVFHLGDVIHDCPSSDYDFYFANRTRLDITREALEGFHAPVHLCLGNHDYGLPSISRETTHRLFAAKLKAPPYKAVEWKGWKFLVLNNFLGETWIPSSRAYDQGTGTLGQEHLQWLEAELAQRKPTVVLTHYPLWLIQPVELADFGLHSLLRKYRESIPLVLSGHWHKWIDFAHTYGPRHIASASTRYDANSFMILELDSSSNKCSFVNEACIDWSTHFSRAYPSKPPALALRGK